MADEETEIEEEEAEGEEGGGGKSKMGLIVIVVVLLAVFAGGGYFAAPYIQDMISPAEAEAETVEEAEPANTQPALFASLHPPLVINITDSYGESHFLQVTLEVMARDQDVINEVKNHSAVIRNSLILMYGSVDFEFVVQRAGKEKMLSDALEEIREIVKRETGMTGIEAVYFTSLIIQ